MKPELAPKFASELYRAFQKLGASADLLSIIGSYSDTLDDAEVLDLLQDYNIGGKALHQQRPIDAEGLRKLLDGGSNEA